MKIMKIIVLALIAAFLITACGGGKQKIDKVSGVVEYPEWWRVQDDPNYVHTFGFATKVSETMATDAARANAMLEAAQYVESEVQGLVKNFEEEIGYENPEIHALTSKVIKEVANAKFSGTMITKTLPEQITTENGKRYKVYVRVSIPRETVNKNLVDQIKREEALYNEFKASQAFQELEFELNK
jgi:PBP1b-binding outer membrane lipoprotein LpoB